MSTTDLIQRLRSGDPRALSRLLSLVERSDPDTAHVMEAIQGYSGQAYCIGVTGSPGVGKSTLVDGLVALLRQVGHTVGVLAVDPTSPFTGGAVLGDRIRMQRHYLDRGVFIRSLATRGSRGGLSRAVWRAVRLLEASGKELVVVETVGVGQSELQVMAVADTVVVVLVPEAGDAVQTMKAGLTEIADIFVVNKADREGANRLANALDASVKMAPGDGWWRPPVFTTQAHKGEGILQVWESIQRHRAAQSEGSHLEERRRKRRRREFFDALEGWLEEHLIRTAAADRQLGELLQEVEEGHRDPYATALHLLSDTSLRQKWLTSLGESGNL